MLLSRVSIEFEIDELNTSIDFRPAGTRATRRFIPMMWIDQVNSLDILV